MYARIEYALKVCVANGSYLSSMDSYEATSRTRGCAGLCSRLSSARSDIGCRTGSRPHHFCIAATMSGIEVAGLVFGVLPILIEAVKAYSTVCSSLRTFRHYSREVKSIFRRLDVHQCIFLNECRLLLRLVEDEQGTEAMLKDKADRRWVSKELNDKLNAVLGSNFQPCQIIIAETKDIIDELRRELMKFDVLKNGKEQVRALPHMPYRRFPIRPT